MQWSATSIQIGTFARGSSTLIGALQNNLASMISSPRELCLPCNGGTSWLAGVSSNHRYVTDSLFLWLDYWRSRRRWRRDLINRSIIDHSDINSGGFQSYLQTAGNEIGANTSLSVCGHSRPLGSYNLASSQVRINMSVVLYEVRFMWE